MLNKPFDRKKPEMKPLIKKEKSPINIVNNGYTFVFLMIPSMILSPSYHLHGTFPKKLWN